MGGAHQRREFEVRGLHYIVQPGGPLALGTGAGIGMNFRWSNVHSFGRPWGLRGAPEGTPSAQNVGTRVAQHASRVPVLEKCRLWFPPAGAPIVKSVVLLQ